MFVLFDSVKKEKVPFESLEPGVARIYVCGPTVYDDAHLGHARSAVAFDLLHRVLKSDGYEVIFAKNFTDIDDKIIKKMKESGQSLEEVTQFYMGRYKNEMASLNILPNTIEPKATQNLEEMKKFIDDLLAKNCAYKLSDGIYFATEQDAKYGSISNKNDDESNRIARVEQKLQKQNPKDFALWKFQEAGDEVAYDASFGRGRPGWHIECSAMIDAHLASKNSEFQIDIHAGGADLLFPHHENEAAQTRCARDKSIAKYWMHNGFVNINGEKMSKSLGNSFFLKDILKNYSGEVVRFYLLGTYYRGDLSFNEEDLLAAKKRLDKIYRLKKRLDIAPQKAEVIAEVLDALNDDLNISKALSFVDEFVSNANDLLDREPKNKVAKKEFAEKILFLNEILGIGFDEPYHYFQFGIDEELKAKIETLIAQRNEAKKQKDYASADAIRAELLGMDISIMDTANGTVWEKK